MANVHPVDGHTSRRRFLSGTATTAAGVAAASVLAASGGCRSVPGASGTPARGFMGSGSVVLFQGDSITDAGRDRGQEKEPNNARALGNGYAFLLACHLLAQHPADNLKIYSRGISGNKVYQLAERWDKDCIALKPSVVSILIGVNDIWHTLNGNYKGTVEVYARDYQALIERTRRELPGVKLVICEPFVLRTGAVNEKWFPEFDLYRAAARKIATTFHAVFVPFQSMFDEAAQEAAPAYWAADGVHPTLAGSYRMARAWLDAVSPTKV